MTLLGNIISIPISLLDQTTKRERKKITYRILYAVPGKTLRCGTSPPVKRGERKTGSRIVKGMILKKKYI